MNLLWQSVCCVAEVAVAVFASGSNRSATTVPTKDCNDHAHDDSPHATRVLLRYATSSLVAAGAVELEIPQDGLRYYIMDGRKKKISFEI